MSRVHEALRRAGWGINGKANRKRPRTAAAALQGLLEAIEEVPFTPAPDSILIDPTRPHDAHSEEFRSLRTRLNHLQKLQPVHSLVITSPCPGEGKSFTAVNLALAEAQLENNPTLLADFDFRRPVLHSLFQIDRAPGATDYLRGEAPLASAIKKVAGMNLYVMPAGQPVNNPLELLNLDEVRNLILQLPSVFNWVVLDSPPLLFTADANLLSTMCDGTILVVRIGSTTVDSVVRAMQSLCENNVLGVVANGARAGELYTKYTYYYSSSYNQQQSPESD
jgi:receptor protein-tyrosine kinase